MSSAPRTHLGLELVGPPRPLERAALDAAERRDGVRYPRSYRALLEEWGPLGQLCGFTWLLDPCAEGPGTGWSFFRGFLQGDARTFRKEYGHWRALDDGTWAHLLVFADLDGKTFAWDTRRADSAGEFPLWFLDREGEVAVRAGRSMEELVQRFLLDGGLDRAYRPGPGGSWEPPATYVTARDPALPERLLAALRAGDEDTSERLLAEHRASVNGYEASSQLVELLFSQQADDLPLELRLEHCERALRWLDRCLPSASSERALREGLACLRAGRSLDSLVVPSAELHPDLEGLELSSRPTRWDLTYLEVTLRNTASAPCPPLVLEATAELESGPAPHEHRFELPSLAPGESYPLSFGWPPWLPRAVRLRVSPA